MERKVEINFSIVFLLSLFFHAYLSLAFFTPSYLGISDFNDPFERAFGKNNATDEFAMRDVIKNINPDGSKILTKQTYLSENDSAAKGYFTEKKGDNWLNNSLDFSTAQGGGEKSSNDPTSVEKDREKRLNKIFDNVEIAFFTESEIFQNQESAKEKTPQIEQIEKKAKKVSPTPGESDWVRIPDKKGITMENALFFSYNGKFSFNTKKFKDYDYFYNMKQKIASNWFPPILANSVMSNRIDPQTNYYTPGYVRNLMIPSQEVKLYFKMNRNGDVLKVVIVDSLGNESLNGSCVDAIANSKNFGKVPDDIEGEEIVIPFIFGYYIVY